MANNYEYFLNASPDEFLSFVRRELEGVKDLSMRCDECKGVMEGMGFDIEYLVSEVGAGICVKIEVRKKPFLIPWKLISKKIDSTLEPLR